MKLPVKQVAKLSILGAVTGYSHYIGVWDVPAETTSLERTVSQWKTVSRNFIDDNVKFEYLKSVKVPLMSDTKDKLAATKKWIPLKLKPSFADNWNACVDYGIESLYILPDKVSSGFGYALAQTQSFVVNTWGSLNSGS